MVGESGEAVNENFNNSRIYHFYQTFDTINFEILSFCTYTNYSSQYHSNFNRNQSFGKTFGVTLDK